MPEEASEHFRAAIEKGIKTEAEWQRRFEAWAAENRELAAEWRAMQAGELPDGWEEALPTFAAGEEVATRKSGQQGHRRGGQPHPLLPGRATPTCRSRP